MKLIGSPNSPFARKVRVLLLEKALPFEWISDLPFAPDTRVPHYNPLGKVPVLVTDAGRTLFDSRVIVEYIETLPSAKRFIPLDDASRIEVKRWEALADGCVDAQAQIIFERRRTDPTKISDEWIAWQATKIDRSLAEMSKELGDRAWCFGDELTLADIAVVCSFGLLDVRLREIPWRTRHPNLSALSDRLSTRPAFRDTTPPGP